MIFAHAAGAAGSNSLPANGTHQVLEEDCITEEELAMEELAMEELEMEDLAGEMSYLLETGENADFGRKKRNLRGADVRRRKTVREVLK